MYNYYAGAPNRPEAMFQILDPYTVQVRWDPVLSVAAYPLTAYKINIDGGAQYSQGPILIDKDTIAVNFTLPDEIDRNACTDLSFIITAENSIGSSLPTVVHGGFPKPTGI